MEVNDILKKSVFELSDEEAQMTGKGHSTLNRSNVLDQFQNKENRSDLSLYLPKSLSFQFCSKPLDRLKRARICEQRVNIPAEDSYLLLHTLVAPVYYGGVLLFVEDHTGELAICFLYEYVYIESRNNLEEDLPPGTAFVLKEPCLKATTAKNFVFVVGSPTDFVVITRSHVLFKNVQDLGWREKSPRNVSEWRSLGNDFFKRAKFAKAVEAYLYALEGCQDQDFKLVLHLNLAATYLSSEYFESAIAHAVEALKIQPANEKALYRAGRAHYQLGQFHRAEQCFQDLVSSSPSNKKGIAELNRCRNRLKEELGNVDIYSLYRASLEKPLLPVDFGSYIGPTEIVLVAGKGRGVISICDLKPGTLVLAEKALVADLNNSSPFGVGIPSLMKNVIRIMLKNPGTYAESIYKLCSGCSCELSSPDVFCDPITRKEVIVDVHRVLEILKTNSVKLRPSKNVPNASSLKCGLFLNASYLNHSCLCNSNCEIYNDVILIRTSTFIPKGEEITISYMSNVETFQVKEELLNFHGFSCSCALCELDRRDTRETHEEREELITSMKKVLDHQPTSKLNNFSSVISWKRRELSRLAHEMEETYKGRDRLAVHLFKLYLHLAENLDYKDPCQKDKFLDTVQRGLKSVGLSTELLFRCAEDSDTCLPRGALLSEDTLFSYVILMTANEFGRDRPIQVSRWIKVLVMLENIFTGGGLCLLRDRVKDLPLMSQLLKNTKLDQDNCFDL